MLDRTVRIKPLGFCSTPSGMLMVLDPTVLQPWMTEDAWGQFLAVIRGGLMGGDAEIVVGPDGETGIVVVGVGQTVLVKQSIGIEALIVDGNVPKDAQ